ncbi:hypothetical protein P152DRAFT_458969 [Eremomyces bilateralis CBS 781.70]|uniref:C2H2-type domain-containing protein n=1 Tax=Eremomyces bilateralis CBS 781.70 TaxID=1392243 RepID=A0A6G1G1M8_9PEZI|nr:uncharacterized protein P152DRAFT_458969 [Eremomyces bilateralis CBS 781.70]KAF1812015.1 hypothetical protein P152DRAFT_458969 [Eremomyces bilateralis CBS 781.70]
MPKAEVGSTKYLNNKLKSKGLQRLRWYCQVCERQMRDENGFKQHTMSEAHVRQMLLVGENSNKFINDYSNQFLKDFLQLLRTAHGEKQVHMNKFYQEYIANKSHTHMNATKWSSLTQLAQHLGREGICRVEETDKGLFIQWIDNTPEALRRKEAVQRKERQDKGDEEREQRQIAEQVERAKAAVGEEMIQPNEARELERKEGEKIALDFTPKAAAPATANGSTADKPSVGISLGKAKVNPLSAKKNPLAGKKAGPVMPQPKKMSEAERIMREEMERKRGRGGPGQSGLGAKRQKMS